jgi:predicted AlkP superfamily phosphohydrolase/phosphomutase
LAEYKKNPAGFATYINTAKQNIYNEAINKHSELYDKAIGDLERASDIQKNVYYYHQRNVDLNNMQEEIYTNMAVNTENEKILNDNARRQFEINEWTVNNRRDTLFVFQIIFISSNRTALH